MPDDLHIVERIKKDVGEDYRWFRSFWHRYESGVWMPQEDIYREIKPHLISARKDDVKINISRFNSVEQLLKFELKVRDQRVIDQVGNYLNFRNGMLNLDTMELEQHSRDKFLTTQLDFDYDDDADCPIFLQFLYDVLVKPDGSPDHQMIALVQELIGYTLSADRSRRISVWLHGESNTGKSTLINMLTEIMGGLQVTIDLNKLGESEFLLTNLPGKRLLSCTECEVGLRLNVAAYKTLVSSDPINVNLKYRDPVSFVPLCVVWWAMNHTPTISDRTDATFNRLVIIPFNRVIPAEKRDYQLLDKIREERAGIVRWALYGYERYRRAKGFTRCEQVETRLNEFRDEIDIYKAFLSDPDYVERVGEIRPLDLYTAFRDWCQERGINSIPAMNHVAKEWRRCGLVMKISSGRYWQGARLVYRRGKD